MISLERPAPHFFRPEHRPDCDDDTTDRTRGSVVELQAFLGEKKRAHRQASATWFNVPTTANWNEVMRHAADVKRIRAAISELTGKPNSKPLAMPWGNS